MKFTCEKSILLSAVNTAARAVSVRNAQPALEGLLVQAEESLKITGYDLEVGIIAVTAADITEAGGIIMPTKMLQDILRKMPDDVIQISTGDNLTINISCGNIDFDLPGLAESDFPNMPELDMERSFTLKQGILKNMLSRVTYALSDNESRIINTGALFDVIGLTLNVVALDGYRLALRSSEIEHEGEDFSFVVPGTALRELEKILKEDNEAEVSILLGRRHIQFSIEDAVLVSRLLEGEFLNYRKAIPSAFKYSIKVNTREFQAAAERVSLLIHEKIRSPLRLTFDSGSISLFCQTALGRGNDLCACEGDGEKLEIGFNNRYLIDALRTAEDEEVLVCLNGSLTPCVIRPLEDGSFINMVLPTRLRAE